MVKIGVIGGGAWGTALAAAVAHSENQVTLWALEDKVVSDINNHHENKTFLSGHPLPATISATNDYSALADCAFILMVCPAQFMRSVSTALIEQIPTSVPLVICSKGIEKGSGAFMSQVLAETAPENPVAVLSGPTFASEVVQGLPSALTLASESDDVINMITKAIGNPAFRPYGSNDIIGAQVGGAVKNILAIACGIVAGRQMGENARAALITRGMAEMIRFSETFGGEAETLMGLSGLGDLILTCSSQQSRNFSLGAALGEGRDIASILAERHTVSEGYHSSVIVHELSEKHKIEMPIVNAVFHILHQNANVNDEIAALLSRPFSKEFD